MTIAAPPGVFDVLPDASPENWRSSYLWIYVETIARQLATLFGYQEIRTPMFERQELFQRGVGDNTDIVSKEMYTFIDRGNRAMALRPEGTASVIRAYIEHRLDQQPSQQKLFYIAPMFRYERSQSGRYRQHHQFGVEVFGARSPAQDAEVIDLLHSFYKGVGLKNIEFYLNTLGAVESRTAFRSALVQYLEKFSNALSEDSQRRLTTNPLRILDSKEAKDQEILAEAPSLYDFLTADEKIYFESVCQLLEAIGISYKVNPKLVRGLDYYNGVVFEATSDALGAQNSIGGGGRYDGLVKLLGGPDVPSCGFGAGLERVIQTLLAQQGTTTAPPCPDIYLVPLGDEARSYCFKLLHRIRQKNILAQMDLAGRKIGKAMQHANTLKAKYSVVIGDNELGKAFLSIKDMATGTTEDVALDNLEEYLKSSSKIP